MDQAKNQELNQEIDQELNQELNQEKDHLKLVRDWIRQKQINNTSKIAGLQDRVGQLKKAAGGTFSQEYELKYNSLNYLQGETRDFAEALDKPYFGRIDFKERLSLEIERFYIGKHGVRDIQTGEDHIVDWRAPIADLYYSKTLGKTEYAAPMGFIAGELSLKRRFTYTKGEPKEIDAYFDEGDQIIVSLGAGEDHALQDEFLRINLEGSSTEKLKEIVATIAGEQNEIIRSPKNIPLIVQGAAGAGKTTVALHRLAYLLYQYRDSLKGSDICIIAPNKLFLDYIAEVLPDLGEDQVVQTTLEDIILKELKIKRCRWSKDEILKSVLEANQTTGRLNAELSNLKGSLRFKAFLNAICSDYEMSHMGEGPIQVHEVTLYSEEELQRLFKTDLKYLPVFHRRREMEKYCLKNLKQRSTEAEKLITDRFDRKIKGIKNIYRDDETTMRIRITETYDGRDAILKGLPKASQEAVKQYYALYRTDTPARIYGAYINDEGFLNDHLDAPRAVKAELGRFDPEEPEADDLVALMYINLIMNGPRQQFAHLVVDEAQDYSPLQIDIMRMLAKQDSMTLVGDLAQGIYSYRSISDWNEVQRIFSGGAAFYSLTRSYRSTIEIIQEANQTLAAMEMDLPLAIPVLRHGMVPDKRIWRNVAEFVGTIEAILEQIEGSGRKTTAIITKTFEEAEICHRLLKTRIKHLDLIDENKKKSALKRVVIPSYMTKGLEFDAVIIADANAYSENPLDQRLKYVALTRALHMEYILSSWTGGDEPSQG